MRNNMDDEPQRTHALPMIMIAETCMVDRGETKHIG
jgi:hypothetical protein